MYVTEGELHDLNKFTAHSHRHSQCRTFTVSLKACNPAKFAVAKALICECRLYKAQKALEEQVPVLELLVNHPIPSLCRTAVCLKELVPVLGKYITS